MSTPTEVKNRYTFAELRAIFRQTRTADHMRSWQKQERRVRWDPVGERRIGLSFSRTIPHVLLEFSLQESLSDPSCRYVACEIPGVGPQRIGLDFTWRSWLSLPVDVRKSLRPLGAHPEGHPFIFGVVYPRELVS